MIKRVLVYILLFLGTMSCHADNVYKNELTKVNLSPVGVNDVKITLHMAKPYSEPLRLLKKNDSEFVLILPETYNSSPQKPSISEVIGDITDTDVKLYSFISNSKENGYTKIVVKTNGTTNIYPEVVSNGGGTISLNSDVKKAVAEKVQNKSNYSTVKIASLTNDNASQKQNPIITPKKEPKYQEKIENISKGIIPNITKLTTKEKMVDNGQVPQTFEPMEESIDQQVIDKDVEASINNSAEIPYVSIKLANNITKPVAMPKKNYGKKGIITLVLLIVCYGIIKKSKKKGTIADNTSNEQKEQYSEFFKTLIEEEVHGNNPFAITSKQEDIEITNNVEPTGGVMNVHEEFLDIDPNLSWQEKFRALKKNKKELFKEDSKASLEENKDEKVLVKTEENETMENPITKIKHDFKAVKKLLAQKKEKAVIAVDDKPIEQKFIGEVEVISFDEYQKNIEPPKVQINTTSPIKSKAPKILSQLHFTPQKGIYLVDYKDKYNLVGFVNDKVFKLNTYNVVRNTKIYARLSETSEGKDTYIVKFDNNKILVDVDDTQMKLKLQY